MTPRTTACLLVLLTCSCPLSRTNDENSKSVPAAVVTALAADEKEFCDQYSGVLKRCHQVFRSHLRWRELVITPSGQTAFLVENPNMDFCGSAGCALYLVRSDGRKSKIIFEEIGTLNNVKVLKTITRGHFDLQKTWRDGKTRTTYTWDGEEYTSVPVRD